MSSRTLLCLGILAAFVLPNQQRPATPVVAVFADPAPPPPTFAALLGRTPLVVVGRVEAAAVRPWGAGSLIDYRVAVVEVLREHNARSSSSNITVAIFGGTIIGTAGQTVRTHGQPQLEIGHVGIFILSYWSAAEAFSPMLWGYFELRGDAVTIPAAASHMPEFGGKTSLSRAEFSALVKSARPSTSWVNRFQN
jgi:hypothetical protein